jgi:hypothetical protein
MLNSKQIELIDNGIKLKLTIKQLPAVQASKLVFAIGKVLVDDNTVKSFIMRQSLMNILQTGVKIEEAKEQEIRDFLKLDTATQISKMVNSLFKGMNDEHYDLIISKVLDAVVYHNGQQMIGGVDIINGDYIAEFINLQEITFHVFMLTFGGTFEKLKKLIDQFSVKAEKSI